MDPLSMICYGIGIVLIRSSRVNFPLQNNNGRQMMDQLPERLQTSVRSLSDFSNLIPTTNTSQNRRRASQLWLETVKVVFAGLNFQVETSSRYLGSCIAEAMERGSWIAIKVDDRAHNIKYLAGAARSYPT